MTPPRRAWPWLAFAGLAACALAARGCVSVVRAADADPIAAEISSLDVLLTGGGITGPLLALSGLIMVLGKYDLLPTRKLDAAPAVLSAGLTRDDMRTIGGELVHHLRQDCDAAHERVRATLAQHEGRMLEIERRAEAHRIEAAGSLATVQTALHGVEKALANLLGRLAPREHA